jgi:hypothetical protein
MLGSGNSSVRCSGARHGSEESRKKRQRRARAEGCVGAERQAQRTDQNTQKVRASSSTIQYTCGTVQYRRLPHLDCVVQADDLLHGAARQEGGDAREVLQAGSRQQAAGTK